MSLSAVHGGTDSSRLALPRSSPSSFRRADCGSICHGGPPGSTNKVPVHEALLAELCLSEICQGPICDCGRVTRFGSNPVGLPLSGR
jgi:hypothetical protein